MFKINRLMASAIVVLGMSSAAFAATDTIYVTNTNDSGTGSFREAINYANTDPNDTYILYNIPGSTDHVISVPTTLPAFTTPVYVDKAPTQVGKTILLAPTISGPGAATTGLTFDPGADGSYVWNTHFQNFVFGIVLKASTMDIQYNSFTDNPGGIDIRIMSATPKLTSILVRLNTFTSTHAGTLAVSGSADYITIFGNQFNGEAVSFYNAEGVFIGGGAATSPNTFINIPGDAVSVNNVVWGTVLFNTFTNIGGNAVDIHGDNIIIARNIISNVDGYEIIAGDGSVGTIEQNTITGNTSVNNGVIIQNADSYSIKDNQLDSTSLVLNNVTSGSGPLGALVIANNTITHDLQGFSGHGALTLNNVTNALVTGNTIHHNASQGIYLTGSSNNQLVNNQIYENGRVGVYIYNGAGNKVSKGSIYYNHADAGGGRTGIFLNSANGSKTAPVITSVKKVGTNLVITGTGAVSGDTIELFKSDNSSLGTSLTQNALQYVASVAASGSSWSATIPAAGSGNYFIATATNTTNNTSMFSNGAVIEIAGPSAAVVSTLYTYTTTAISGATYSWWIGGNGVIVSGQGTNEVVVRFDGVGSATVNVGISDVSGYRSYQLAVAVSSSLRTSSVASSVDAEVYPNPFAETTRVKIVNMEGESTTLNLYDLKGELVFSSKGYYNGQEVELGNRLTPGIYSLQIVSGDNVKTVRIIKSH